MFVDLWVVSIFSILFGVCAVWNRMRGIHVGIEKTLDKPTFTYPHGVEKMWKPRRHYLSDIRPFTNKITSN